jgi:hypothetical protein
MVVAENIRKVREADTCMKLGDYEEPHRRFNPRTGEWVLV